MYFPSQIWKLRALSFQIVPRFQHAIVLFWVVHLQSLLAKFDKKRLFFHSDSNFPYE